MYTVNHGNHTPINPSGFRWMPAAVQYSDHGGLGCYVRYHRYRDEPIRVHHRETNRIIFTCPDRDLMIVRDQHYQWPYKPAEGVWDEFVSFSMFRPNAMPDNDLQFFMINYTDYIGSDTNSPLMRAGRERAPHEPFVVADSGGFQLSHGRYDWLDPLKVVNWYNQNIDLGMVLDIPPGGVDNLEDFLTLAKAQAHNTKLMLEHKRPSLELMNIFHGRNKEWLAKYRAIVETPEIDRLAIGGTYDGTFMTTIDNNFSIMSGMADRYKHFHVLGVWNLLQLIPFMRFASHGIVKLLTSDSSTPIQNANAKRYAYHPAIDDTWRMRDLGMLAGTTYPNHHLTLPCACNVCQTLKYTDILSIMGGAALTHILAHHNVFQMNNYVKTMTPLVKDLSIKELTELMLAQVGNRRGIQEARWGLQLADAIAQDGYEMARKKFSSFLSTKTTSVHTDSNLFDLDETVSEDGVEPTSHTDNEPTTEDGASRKLRLARRFLSKDLSAQGVHGKKLDTAPKGMVIMNAKSSSRKTMKPNPVKAAAKPKAAKATAKV